MIHVKQHRCSSSAELQASARFREAALAAAFDKSLPTDETGRIDEGTITSVVAAAIESCARRRSRAAVG
jgi:hypothetical protein